MSTTVVAILGMHRSGTSWLAGSLQGLGLELGPVDVCNRHNMKGNRENKTIRLIHKSVLKENGGSWRDPKWPNAWSPKQQRRLGAHIAAMNAQYPMWGFKEPRSLMVMDEWHRQVPNLVRVGIYRHPIAVYRSLKARHDDFTRGEALELWRRYNLRLLDELRSAPFPVLRFDADPALLRAALVSTSERLGLPADRPEAFFDGALVHHGEAAAEAIPSEVADVWAELQGFSAASG